VVAGTGGVVLVGLGGTTMVGGLPTRVVATELVGVAGAVVDVDGVDGPGPVAVGVELPPQAARTARDVVTRSAAVRAVRRRPAVNRRDVLMVHSLGHPGHDRVADA
jgi:hypothetical protein